MQSMKDTFSFARRWCTATRKPNSQQWLRDTHKVTAAEQHYETLRATHMAILNYIETHGVIQTDETVSVNFDPAFLSNIRKTLP